jgi:hypothetical protein
MIWTFVCPPKNMDVLGTGVLNLCLPPLKKRMYLELVFWICVCPQKNTNILGTGVLDLCLAPKKYQCTWNWCFKPVFGPKKNINVLGTGVLNLCLTKKNDEAWTGVHRWLLHIPDLHYNWHTWFCGRFSHHSVLQFLDFSKEPPVLDIKKIKIKEPLDPGYLQKREWKNHLVLGISKTMESKN